MTGCKHKCPGCTTLLSRHSFGQASKQCEGPNIEVHNDQVEDPVHVGEPCEDVTSAVSDSSGSPAPESELSLSLAAQRAQNRQLCKELAMLQ